MASAPTGVSGGASTAPNKGARPRTAARLAAVQALYQMEFSGVDVNQVIAEFLHNRLGQEIDGTQYPPADEAWFSELVRGTVSRQDDIDDIIAQTVSADWSLPRLDATLRALIRVATYELVARPDVPPKVVLNEYVSLAHAFFSGSEPGFANGVLDRVARQVRPHEYDGDGREKT